MVVLIHWRNQALRDHPEVVEVQPPGRGPRLQQLGRAGLQFAEKLSRAGGPAGKSARWQEQVRGVDNVVHDNNNRQ